MQIRIRIRIFIWCGSGFFFCGCGSGLPKWCGSMRIRIRIHNTGSQQNDISLKYYDEFFLKPKYGSPCNSDLLSPIEMVGVDGDKNPIFPPLWSWGDTSSFVHRTSILLLKYLQQVLGLKSLQYLSFTLNYVHLNQHIKSCRYLQDRIRTIIRIQCKT